MKKKKSKAEQGYLWWSDRRADSSPLAAPPACLRFGVHVLGVQGLEFRCLWSSVWISCVSG